MRAAGTSLSVLSPTFDIPQEQYDLIHERRAQAAADVMEWLDWMRVKLPLTDVEMPGAEDSELFVADALRLVERVRPLCRHLPESLRSHLVEAIILHRCWDRQLALAETPNPSSHIRCKLHHVNGIRPVEFRKPMPVPFVQACDGVTYRICVCQRDRPNRLATEAIASTLARLTGLTVAPISIVNIGRNLASELGLPKTAPNKYPLRTLGVADSGFPLAKRRNNGGPGLLLFKILTMNEQESDQLALEHCFAGSDWARFSAAQERPIRLVGHYPQITNFAKQFTPWVNRLVRCDRNLLWDVLFRLPSEWHGHDRVSAVNLIQTISKRIWLLPQIVHRMKRAGQFPNLNFQILTHERLTIPHESDATCTRSNSHM